MQIIRLYLVSADAEGKRTGKLSKPVLHKEESIAASKKASHRPSENEEGTSKYASLALEVAHATDADSKHQEPKDAVKKKSKKVWRTQAYVEQISLRLNMCNSPGLNVKQIAGYITSNNKNTIAALARLYRAILTFQPLLLIA